MMFWPSKMSLEPPPVTPSRKLPPLLGLPGAADEAVDGVPPLVVVPHAAASPPAASTAAPEKSCRRETSAIGKPFCWPARILQSRVGDVSMRVAEFVTC